MSIGKRIGRGNTAEIFEYGDNDVIKLFYEKIPAEYIEREYNTSIRINQMGIAAANVGDLTELDNRRGIIYEKVTGRSFTQMLSSNPLLLKRNARFFAELQASFHTKTTNELPSQKEVLARNISGTSMLRDEEKAFILRYLEQLPAGNHVCHGDYHSDNVIVRKQDAKILDWMTGTSGNPCADVARTYMIMKYAYLPPDLPKATRFIIQTVRKWFTRFYLNAYIKAAKTSAESVEQWMLPVMAARLVEGVPEPEKHWLAGEIRCQIGSL